MNFEFFLSFRSVPQCLNFPLFRTLKNYFLCVKIFFEIPKFFLGTSPFKLIFSILKISSYVLNNNFSYIQPFLVFFYRRLLISIMMILMLFPFSSSKILLNLSWAFFLPFFFFFFTNILTSFTCFFFEAFFFWWYLLSNFIYIY